MEILDIEIGPAAGLVLKTLKLMASLGELIPPSAQRRKITRQITHLAQEMTRLSRERPRNLRDVLGQDPSPN
jgi:Flp pilus assembly CpaE family ATPase